MVKTGRTNLQSERTQEIASFPRAVIVNSPALLHVKEAVAGLEVVRLEGGAAWLMLIMVMGLIPSS